MPKYCFTLKLQCKKGTLKKKGEYFNRKKFFLAKPAKNTEKRPKNDFSVLLISMCRILPKKYYHLHYKEDSNM